MSMVDAPLALMPPRLGSYLAGTAVNFTFDGTADMLACVFQVPKTGTIDNVHYRIESVSGVTATHRIELRTVSATTGQPSAAGTLYGSSTSITVAASGYAATTNYTAAVNCTGATFGDLCALVFDLTGAPTGSFVQADRVGPFLGDVSTGRTLAFPYGVRNTTGSGTLGVPVGQFLLEYSGGIFVPVSAYHFNFVGGISSAAVTNSGTTRRGNKFRPATKRRAIGIYGTFDIDGNVTLTLRDSGGTLLATATPDKDVRGTTSFAYSFYNFDSGDTETLTAGSDYYIGMEGQDATGGTIYYATAPSNAALGAMPGGLNTYGFTYAGSYSDANTTLYDIGLITDQEDDGASAGGTTIAGTPMLRGMV